MPSIGAAGAEAQPAAQGDRALWVGVMQKLADPVLNNLAGETLKQRMPVEQAAGAKREGVTHLEALGPADGRHRAMAGTAGGRHPPKGRSGHATAHSRGGRSIAPSIRSRRTSSTSPVSASRSSTPRSSRRDCCARRARSPMRWSPATRRNLIAALESSRVTLPGFNNWLLFSATVEAALFKLGAPWDRMRVDYALRQHDQWYKGDGAYGDGPDFHFDYYNSFVIHPMLLDVLDALSEENAGVEGAGDP